MGYLSYPSKNVWETREEWYTNQIDLFQHEYGSYLVSEHACALVGEVQIAYCAGAYIAVIILAFNVIDSHLRDTEALDSKINSKRLIEEYYPDGKVQALRMRRNAIVHSTPGEPVLTSEQQWNNRVELETEAKEAITLMFKVLFSNPGT
jgi:hypothetical protein